MFNDVIGVRSAFSSRMRRVFALMALPLIAGALTACDQPVDLPANVNKGFEINYYGVPRWEGSWKFRTLDEDTYAFCASPNGLKSLGYAYYRYDTYYQQVDPGQLRKLSGPPIPWRFVEGTGPIDAKSRRALLTAMNWFGNSGMRLSYLDPKTGDPIDERVVHAALSLVTHEYLNSYYAVSPDGFRRMRISELQPGVNFTIPPQGDFTDWGNVYAKQVVELAKYMRGFSWAYANGGYFDGRHYFGLGDLPYNPVHMRPLKIEELMSNGSYQTREAGSNVRPGAVLRITGGAYATRTNGQNIPLRNLPIKLFNTEGMEPLTNKWQHTNDAGYVSYKVRVPVGQTRVWNFDTWIWGAGIGNTSAHSGRQTYRFPGADDDRYTDDWSKGYGTQDAVRAFAKDGHAEKAVQTNAGPPPTTRPTTTTTRPFELPVGS